MWVQGPLYAIGAKLPARSLQAVVLLVGYRLEPHILGVLAGHAEGQMGKPAVGGCAVPVLHIGGDMDHGAGQNLLRGLTLLLIPSAAGDADQHLTATLGGLVDVPVVAAAGLEGDIRHLHLLARDGRQIAVADEILGIGSVGLADGEDHLALEGGLGIALGGRFGPHLLGQTESRPRLRPAGVEGYVGDDLGGLGAGDAVFLRRLKVKLERRVGDTLRDERGDGHQAAVAERKQVVAAPHLSEKYIVVEMSELRSELAQSVAPCCLYDFLLCHNVECQYAELN